MAWEDRQQASLFLWYQIRRNKRLQSTDAHHQNQKLGYLDVVFQTHTQLPVGWRREVEGSTPAIRLQRPFIMVQDIPKKIK
ncbi:MAG: hypothetical protein OXU23_09365 [Candidatus Poribacteria bacterium]|nr:hypothetical protein [Candidatus Poribacteria bacterium]